VILGARTGFSCRKLANRWLRTLRFVDTLRNFPGQTVVGARCEIKLTMLHSRQGFVSRRFLNSECDWSVDVSIDKTLRTRLGLSRSRNVLTRGERIAQLIEEDRFAVGRSPFGLPKVRVQKAMTGKKKKKTPEETAAAAAATPAKGAAKGKK